MRWAGISFIFSVLTAFHAAWAQESPLPETAAPAAAEPAPSGNTKAQLPVEMIEGLLQEQTPLTGNGFVPSFGKWQHSLFFKRADAESIKRILTLFESGALAKEAAEPADPDISEIIRDLQIQTGSKEVKPVVYPRFKLRSIIYRSPAEWVILLNDIRISSYNNTAEKELTVLDVGKNSASFKWKPSDEELRAELAREAAIRQNASRESALKNRAAVGAIASFDKESRSVFFKLSVNQEFDAKTFDIQEGASAKQKTADSPPTTTGAPEDSARAPTAAVPSPSQPFPSMQPVTNPLAPAVTKQPPSTQGAESAAASPPQQTTPAAPASTEPPIPAPTNPLVPVPAPAPTN